MMRCDLLASMGEYNRKLENEVTAVKEYKYKGETFQLDDSKGCYVAATYKHLTGYVGVNLGLIGGKVDGPEAVCLVHRQEVCNSRGAEDWQY